jgi:hypothetical protein
VDQDWRCNVSEMEWNEKSVRTHKIAVEIVNWEIWNRGRIILKSNLKI